VKSHPIFARAWDTVVRLGGKPEREHRRELAAGARGRILEFGAGTGLNFRLYPGDVTVVAVEPEPTMARTAEERAGRAAATVHVLRGSAEALPFPDGTFDTAVACLVFCTIPDPLWAAGEIKRVLRPGGELRLYEHVRSPHPRGARWQDRVLPVWRHIGAGCHPNRDTVGTLRAAGFDVEVRPVTFGPPTPVRPHVLGVATPR
jgi:SAM-dependent methyltransferase